MPSNHLIPCHHFLLLPSVFPSIRVFSSESALRIRWPKYWSFSFTISPSSEYSGLISFRIDWLDLLAVQGTLKSLLQHHNSKASTLQHPAFFVVQLSHPYMTQKKQKFFLAFVGLFTSLFLLHVLVELSLNKEKIICRNCHFRKRKKNRIQNNYNSKLIFSVFSVSDCLIYFIY